MLGSRIGLSMPASAKAGFYYSHHNVLVMRGHEKWFDGIPVQGSERFDADAFAAWSLMHFQKGVNAIKMGHEASVCVVA